MDANYFDPVALSAVGASAAWVFWKVKYKKKGTIEVVPQQVFLAEVRGNPHPGMVTVTYGMGDSRKKVCMHIPPSLNDSHLSEIPIEQILTPLPSGWLEYLMNHPEAKF